MKMREENQKYEEKKGRENFEKYFQKLFRYWKNISSIVG